MKIQKKIEIIIILSIAILFVLLTNSNYAVNETNNNTNQNSQTNQNTKNNSSNTETTKTTKSNNANLSDLGIKPHDFKGFNYATTSYEAVVPGDVESIEVYAKTQDSKATLTGTGKKQLEKGENKLNIEVTAEDGTKKTYTINIIREIVQESEQKVDETKKEKGLANLQINELTLSPKFATNVYEYNVKYIGQDNKLQVTAEPTNKDYIVETTGNDHLQEGENTITILVSDKNGDNIATYQVIVNKSLIDEEAVAKEKIQNKVNQQKIASRSYWGRFSCCNYYIYCNKT